MRLLTLGSFGLLFPSILTAQAVDTALVLGALRDYRVACAREAGETWGRSLCGPVALVEPTTLLVIANDTVAGRRFLPFADAVVTTLPPDLGLANTSFTWGDRAWAMVLTRSLPASRFARTALLAHEAFHREQPALRLTTMDAPNAHLEEEHGRRLLRLELRALAAALDARDEARRSHVENALIFRARRRAVFPGADTLETQLEMQEGLAEYTGVRVALLAMPDSLDRATAAIRAAEDRRSFVRSFAYGTAPALGLLLDAFAGASWRDSVLRAAPRPVDLSRLLAGAARIRLSDGARLARDAEQRAAAYGGDAVARAEAERALARRRQAAAYRAKLVDGPVLSFRQRGLQRAFNPNELFPLAELGVVYPTGTFSAEWGTLHVTEGALVSADFTLLRVAAPTVADTTAPPAGPGWTLQLAEGWELRASSARPGDYEVRRRSP